MIICLGLLLVNYAQSCASDMDCTTGQTCDMFCYNDSDCTTNDCKHHQCQAPRRKPVNMPLDPCCRARKALILLQDD